MKRILPTAVVLALLILAGWLSTHKLQSPVAVPPDSDDQAELALPDTPEGSYARRLIEASIKDGGSFPEPIRVKDLLDSFEAGEDKYRGKLVIVVGTVAKVDQGQVDFADEQPGRSIFCRATFLNPAPAGLKPGDVVTVAGDCQGMTGPTVRLVDAVLLTDEFTAKVSELLSGLGKNRQK